jgi:L-2-hydroxyglutarate oxidase LhgO
MTAYSGLIVTDSDSRRRKPSQLNWLAEGVVVASRLGTPATTAIVHPLKFTSGMMRAAQRNGATLQLGRVTGIVRDTHEMTARGVQMDGSVLEADAVVIAMGPWSLLASEWMSLPAVSMDNVAQASSIILAQTFRHTRFFSNAKTRARQ